MDWLYRVWFRYAGEPFKGFIPADDMKDAKEISAYLSVRCDDVRLEVIA